MERDEIPDAWLAIQYPAKIKKVKIHVGLVIYRLQGFPKHVQVPDMIEYALKFIKGHKKEVEKLQ